MLHGASAMAMLAVPLGSLLADMMAKGGRKMRSKLSELCNGNDNVVMSLVEPRVKEIEREAG